MYMNKKQTIRTLGTIESKQTKQCKQPTQPKQTKQPTQPTQTKKKLNKDLDLENDDNIERYSDDNDDDKLEEINLEISKPDVKQKKREL